MSLSTITIPVPSSYVNTFIFAIFDILIVSVIDSAMCSTQASLVRRRLCRGQTIKLGKSRLSPFVGGLLLDRTFITRMLMILRIAMLLFLFYLTTNVNGTTQIVHIPVTRRYITRLPANAELDFNKARLRPQVFSSCVTTSNASIRFYPTAFDTERNITLANLFDMRDKDGNNVNIDVPNLLCQNSGKLPPMLIVRRCGDVPQQCENLAIQNRTNLEFLPKDQNSTRRTEENILLGVGNGDITGRLIVLYRNIRFNASSGRDYNRILCKERSLQGEENSNDLFYFNCIVGKWNNAQSVFTFSLGQVTFERSNENLSEILNTTRSKEVQFTSSSTEMEVEWDAGRDGETLFADGLSAIGQDFITGRRFLDSTISRTVVAEEVNEYMEILSEEQKLVTTISGSAFISYGALAVISIFCLVFLCVRSLEAKRYGGFVDVTDYSGVAALLRREIGIKEPYALKWTEFGFTRNSDQNGVESYRLRAVRDDDEVVGVPVGKLVEI